MPTVKKAIGDTQGPKPLHALAAHLNYRQLKEICKLAKMGLPFKAILWWRMGLGKTRSALALWELLKSKLKKPRVCLIICPPKAIESWKNEIRTLLISDRICIDWSSMHWGSRPTFWITSYGSLEKVLQNCNDNLVDFIIIDELYLYGNSRTIRSKQLRKLSERKNCIGLSGSIMSNKDNSTIWGQCAALGIEKTLARNFTEFRSLYQTRTQIEMGVRVFQKFANAPNSKNRIIARLQKHVSINFSPLPINESERKIKIALAPTQAKLIKELSELFEINIGGMRKEFNYTLQTINIARGICNGWVEREGSGLLEVGSGKREALSNLLEKRIREGRRTVVWCAFINDVKYLSEKLPFTSLQFVGGKKFDFEEWNKGTADVVYATIGSGSSVNFFGDIDCAVFYSLAYSPLQYEQSKGRHMRQSSKHSNVLYVHLIASGLDALIHKHLQKASATEKDFINSATLWLTNN